MPHVENTKPVKLQTAASVAAVVFGLLWSIAAINSPGYPHDDSGAGPAAALFSAGILWFVAIRIWVWWKR